MKIVVVGSGTAGLIAALQIKSIIKTADITILSSGQIPIIGVGEGSTEHWTAFERLVNFDRTKMVESCKATYKFGIRFKNWRVKPFDDYFHSVGHQGYMVGTFNSGYAVSASENRQLTPMGQNPLIREGFVADINDNHRQTNQFHFDTFALNAFLSEECRARKITFVDGLFKDVVRHSETGFITHLITDSGFIDTDFVIDATGFRREVFLKVAKPDWVSFKKYLPSDSAIATPTPARADGKIMPYTMAEALSAGWRWEIPTQERRGNGYVYSSSFISDDEAISELSKAIGYEIENPRVFKFEPGYIKNPWVFNCCVVGLSSSFVEPLEATSIAAAIQQSVALTGFLPTSHLATEKSRAVYNRAMSSMMENILVMIAMHYVSDRDDSPMWREQARMPLPPLLEEFMDVISLRGPMDLDIPRCGFELFGSPHFWHVAQGQGLLNTSNLNKTIDATDSRMASVMSMWKDMSERRRTPVIPHRDALTKWKAR